MDGAGTQIAIVVLSVCVGIGLVFGLPIALMGLGHWLANSRQPQTPEIALANAEPTISPPTHSTSSMSLRQVEFELKVHRWALGLSAAFSAAALALATSVLLNK